MTLHADAPRRIFTFLLPSPKRLRAPSRLPMTLATALRTTASVLLVALLLGAGDAAAQAAGKISGRVTDTAGQPVPGASVLVVETSRGTTTDADGYYTILNVRAGTYTLRVSFLGYAAQVVEGVNVNIDQTTTINATLQDETELIDEVVVRAERPPVELDVSNSRTNIGAGEIQALPVASVTGAVGLQAGVQGLSIRGSSSDQVSFQVNGLTLRDERNNAPFTNISLSSVEEIQVQTGGFNAEYGNVRSGVVNVVTKEGDPNRYEATAILRISPPAQKHRGILANDPNAYWVRPFLDPEVAFTGTQNWDPITQSQYEPFEGWNAVSQGLLADDDPTNDMTPQALQQAFLWQHRKSMEIVDPDYDVDLGFGGPVPGARALGNLRFYASLRREEDLYMIPLHTDRYEEQTGHLKLTSDLAPGMKLSVEGRLGESAGTGASRSGQPGFFRSSTGIARNLSSVSFIDSRIFSGDYWGPSEVAYNQLGATFNHAPTATSVYEIRFNRFASTYDTNPGRLRDRTPVVSFGGVGFDEAPFGWSPSPSDGVDGMRMGVGMSNSRDSSSTVVYSVQGAYTNQLNRFLEVKTGLEYALTQSDINYAQVDSFLTGSNFRVTWDREPVRAAAFAQSKLEFQGMIANLGLRLDYSHAGGFWYDFGTFEPAFGGLPLVNGEPEPALDTLLTTAPTRRILNLSPRLGVSFPVTAVSKLFFNYGHFRQLPDSDDLYLVRALENSGQVRRIADPNNPLPQTIAYELGYEQAFFGRYLARVAGYYKDITLDPRLVTYVSRSGSVTYDLTEPNNFSDIRGFELTLSKTQGDYVRGFVNYTYDVRQSGFFGFRDIFENSTEQRQQEESDALRRAASSRPVPQPFARLNLDFFSPAEFGPRAGGLYPLGGWQMSVLGRWQDGGRFTWGDNGVAAPGVARNVDIRDFWQVDLRFSRSFTVGGRRATFFADVFNLTDRRDLSLFTGARDGNDRNAYLASLHFPEGEYSNIPGNDVVGDFRPDDVAFQPMRPINTRDEFNAERPADEALIYYERDSASYIEFRDGAWQNVEAGRLQEVLDTKAYIDMPNQTYLNFLDPRDIFFGIRLSL